VTVADIIAALRGRLIVSCQAPFDSPLHDPYVIARMALAAEQGGAVAVRIDGPDHIRAVRALCTVPIIGLHKQVHEGSDVYITPTRQAAEGVVAAGGDIVAVDATRRPRPGAETLEAVIDVLRMGPAIMADISTEVEGLAALDLGVDLLATTLSGYTADSPPRDEPDFDLVAALSACARSRDLRGAPAHHDRRAAGLRCRRLCRRRGQCHHGHRRAGSTVRPRHTPPVTRGHRPALTGVNGSLVTAQFDESRLTAGVRRPLAWHILTFKMCKA
jgi:N-acylglucosamine-6-phosphate 2-epimerase